MNESSNKNILLGGVLVLLLAGAAVYSYINNQSKGNNVVLENTASSTVNVTMGATSTNIKSGKVEMVTSALSNALIAASAPSYAHTLTCKTEWPADYCKKLADTMIDANTALNKNPKNGDAWIAIGMLRKQVGDYTGAESAWKYAAILSPNIPTAYDNLGDLYQNFTHQDPLAEASYKSAIRVYPEDPASYINLYNLYAKDGCIVGKSAPIDILKQGIVANPKAVELQITLARCYRLQGDVANAKALFMQAIATATTLNNLEQAASIKAEMDK